MTLDKQRWRQVETLYHAALEAEVGHAGAGMGKNYTTMRRTAS